MDQPDFFQNVIALLEKTGLEYMVVGSYASGFWGEPRMTYDVDLVVALTESNLARLLTNFTGDEYYFSPEAAQQAVRNHSQFNIIHPDSGNKIDVVVRENDEFAIEQLQRRQSVAISSNTTGHIATPEDVILGKLRFYQEGGSEKHLRDIAGILKVQADKIDYLYLNDRTTRLGLTEEWKLFQPK